jgi:hypothetical protein
MSNRSGLGSSAGENLGIYNRHPHAAMDSEEATRPVDVAVALADIVICDYDDKLAHATFDVRAWFFWCALAPHSVTRPCIVSIENHL